MLFTGSKLGQYCQFLSVSLSPSSSPCDIYFPKFYKVPVKYIHRHLDLLLELDGPQRKNIPFFPNVRIYLKALSDQFAYFLDVPWAFLFLRREMI